MTEIMKALVWDGTEYPDSLELKDFPKPLPGTGWALVNVKAVGICGSDLHYLLGQTRHLVPDENLPAVLGHENAGVVVDVGEGVTKVKPGDRVGVEPIHKCTAFGQTCPMCEIGQYPLCASGLGILGIPVTKGKVLPGGYGEYIIVHEEHLYKAPDSVPLDEAALLDVLTVDVHAIKRGRPSMGDTVVVLGCGVIGLDAIQCVRIEGVSDIIAVARYGFQAEAAKKLGAKEVVCIEDGDDPVEGVMKLTGGWGVDQVYECVGGDTDAVEQGIHMCRPGGKVIMIGVFSGQRPIDLLTMILKEVDIISSSCYSTWGYKREYQIGMDLLASGQVNHRDLITHRFPIEDWQQAFEAAIHKKDNETLRAVFERH